MVNNKNLVYHMFLSLGSPILNHELFKGNICLIKMDYTSAQNPSKINVLAVQK